MKILSFFRKPKPMEKPMSVEIKPSALRAVNAYKKLAAAHTAAHAAAAAKIIEQDGMLAAAQANSVKDAEIIASLEGKIAETKAILDEVFPEDVGGSTGGVVR